MEARNIPEGHRIIAVGEILPNGKGAFKLQWTWSDTWQPSDGSFRDHRYASNDAFFAAVPISKPSRKRPEPKDTSLQALKSQKDRAPTDCARILKYLEPRHRGRTCDRVEQALYMSHQTASARIRDLAATGRIVDSGRREKTRTGRPAICWKVVKA